MLNPKTIMMVDDNISNLRLGRSILGGAFNVFTMQSGEKLFAMLERVAPDLFLLDVIMPRWRRRATPAISKGSAHSWSSSSRMQPNWCRTSGPPCSVPTAPRRANALLVSDFDAVENGLRSLERAVKE